MSGGASLSAPPATPPGPTAGANAAAPYGFDEYLARAAAKRRRRRVARRAVALVAVALLLAAGVAPWLARPEDPGYGLAARERVERQAPVRPPIDQSWLAYLPAEPSVVSVETRMAVVALEDRIAWIDDSLSASATRGDVLARIQQLEDERARLVDSLVRVRYAEQLAAVGR